MSVETRKSFIHPTAIIDPEAELGTGVTVGPYSIIEANVIVGDGTSIGARVTIEGHTTIGKENQIFTGAVIGSVTQDKKYTGGVTYLRIGDRNTTGPPPGSCSLRSASRAQKCASSCLLKVPKIYRSLV